MTVCASQPDGRHGRAVPPELELLKDLHRHDTQRPNSSMSDAVRGVLRVVDSVMAAGALLCRSPASWRRGLRARHPAVRARKREATGSPALRARSAFAARLARRAAVLVLLGPSMQVVADHCPASSAVSISHVTSESWCELCGTGQVTIRVYYFGANNHPITDLVISEDFQSSGLVPIPDTTTFAVRGGGANVTPGPVNPTQSGTTWSWDLGGHQLVSGGQNQSNGEYLELTFQVRRANGVSEEGLWSASKNVTASVSYSSTLGAACGTESQSYTLPFRAPAPDIIKLGRNVDAGQSSGQYSDPVYGHNNDDIIWRIEIRNNGLAAMQDVRLDDLMQPGNVVINYACPTEETASTIANSNGGGPIPAGCIPASNTIGDFVVADPFGSPATTDYGPNGGATNGFTRNLNGRDIDAGGIAFIYLVGKITADASCISGGRTNTVSNVQFGCEADNNGAGGIPAGSDTATLRTYHGDTGNHQLTVQRRFTGVNTVGMTTVSSRPVGARGLVILTITNNTGGTVKDIYLEDVLPPQYVVDPTYWSTGTTKVLPVRATPTQGESSINARYGAYAGMIDRITWLNPQGSLASPSQDPLQNTRPRFRLWSSAAHPDYPEQIHMLRQGDVVTVTFPIVLISQDRASVEPYDLRADLDVTPEVTADGTDPAYTASLTNQLTIDYSTFCASQGNAGAGAFRFSYTDTVQAHPEDLDIAITDINNNPGSVFILTNDPSQQLPLRVRVTNNGGHHATNYRVFASFGATMQVMTAPAGCSPIAVSGTPPQPNPWKVWVRPAPIPATATVYQCTQPASIAPGATVNLDFSVIKSSDPGRVALDDLAFRADVVGEVSLYGSSGTPYDGSALLWFPTPITRPDGQLDRTNNYSLDGVRQRVIGFNLIKTKLACNENDPPLTDPGPYTKPAERVEIGEECSYRVRTGGWFGFETPGFVYIAVEDVVVTDNLPAGQGYVSSTDPYLTSSGQIREISLMGVPVPPTPNGLLAPGAPFSWNFNQTSRIRQLDEWFQADVTARVLNYPVNVRGDPNRHTANSRNVLVSTFDAIFADDRGEFSYNLGPSTVGYPNEPIRREDLTVTEPHLVVEKHVCNESLHGTGTACNNWTTLTDEGDTYDSYIFRITVRNEAVVNGLASAPAYDVVVTDTLDASDLMYVVPFAADGLDNDGDGQAGAGDADEGGISDNAVLNGVPPVITFSHAHSTALRRIDPGAAVQLYYRVDPDQRIAPRQVLTNTVTAAYDTLAGSSNSSGNQTVDPRPNGDIGGARVYTTATAQARVQIIPLQTFPKEIVALSATPIGGTPQGVVIGEEIRYRLTAHLPVARLRSFFIQDYLPGGMRCTEAPVVDLSQPPYSAAGFTRPDGSPVPPIVPTCATDRVVWDFGDVVLTQKPPGSTYFVFPVSFIARVDNTAANSDGTVLSNGTPATNATLYYVDDAGQQVVLEFGRIDVVVREPQVAITKSFLPVVNADAGDELTVTVTATNNGTSSAYNLRILDDLVDRHMTFIQGSVSGTDPPSEDVTTLGANRPIFYWAPTSPLAPGATRTFTFRVRVDPVVQPLEVLDNTLQADWTSLPSQATALNSSGQIGANGSTTGMRTGALPNAAHPINDYETTTAASVSVPAVVLAKTDLAPATVPTIGAHKPFQIEIRLPEGTTRDLVVSDDLAASGLSYVFANNATFDITYVFEGIASINGQPPGEGAFNAFPADNTSGVAVWNIGTVVTATENDRASGAVNPVLRINYYARIHNDLDTDAGDTLRNGALARHRHGETGAQETLNAAVPAVTVVEPRITLSKTVANVSSGKQPGDPPVAGDLLEYRVVAANTGTAAAFDLNLVDRMPAGVVLYGGFTPTATINSVPVAGFVATPAGAPAGPLVWGRGNGDGGLDVPAGQTLTLTYRAVVQIVPAPDGLIENGVLADWTSLEAPSPYERTGAGCPTITAPNDYCAGPVVAATIGIPPALEFRKTVINMTTGQNPGTTASPGDLLRYRIQVRNVRQAPVSNFTLIDDLDALNDPARFAPGTLTLVSVPPGADASRTSPTGGARGTGLVDVRNLSVGVAGSATDTVVVEFEVRLAPVMPHGTVVLNQAQLTANGLLAVSDDPNVNGPDDPQVGGDEDPTRTVIQSAPAFRVQKTSQDLTGDPNVLFAGDRLRYTITVKNIGTESATNVTLRDPVPVNTTYAANSTTLNGAAVADPAPGTSPLAAGMLIHAPEDPTPGAMRADATDTAANVATVTFEVAVDAGVPNGTQIANQGFVNGTGGAGTFPEKPSDDPATPAADDPTVNVVSGLVFQKSAFNVTTGGSGATARPGDTLRYRLEITNSGTVPLSNFSVLDEIQGLQPSDSLYFVPGTLALVSVPPGADATNTNPNGGARGAGLLDVRNLSVPGGGTVAIEFTVQLAPVVTNATVVLNQAELQVAGLTVRRSDSDDAALSGEEDATRTVIQSAPAFRVRKTSQDLTGDPNVLMAGDSLRYTITVQNIGTENAVNVVLRDQIPANTTYLPGSTTLNGAPVGDVAGVSPLQGGLPIHAPEDPTPGAMRADATGTTANVATVTFTVVVNADVVDGTILANQGFVNGAGKNSGPFPEQPSDDPATPIPDDPTRDIVGNLPLVYALKTVRLVSDNGSPGLVDPDDVLRYTITVSNFGATPATGVVLRDAVPAKTTYVANTVTLNGLPVGQPDGGISPLVAGIPVSSADSTPPLPLTGNGTLSQGGTATITFDLRVNSACSPPPPAPDPSTSCTTSGDIVLNQARVTTNELPALPTDSDGNPGNGYQPTEVVVGDRQQLRITKEVFVVGAGAAAALGQLEYVVRVTNISAVPATNVVITDDLSPIGPDPYVPGSGTLNGLPNGVSYTAPVLTADYGPTYGDLPPGASAVLRFRVNVPPGVPIGTRITNTAVVSWNTPTQNASASASVDIGGIPGSAILSGRAWHDANFNDAFESSERLLTGWTVEVYRGGTRLASASTDSAGAYRFSGLAPNDTTADRYEIRFRAPGAGPGTATLGEAHSPFTNGPQRITDIVAGSGSNVLNLNLPIDPNGVVYEAVARTPIAGATLTLLAGATRTPLPAGCFADPAQQGQVTLAGGHYKFDLNFSDPSCAPGADYLIEVTAPPAYGAAPSAIIPPTTGGATPPYSVPACPDDAVAATDRCEAQGSELAPAASVPPRSTGTRYYLHLTLSNAQVPQDSQLFNNHLPIDPRLEAAIAISKTSPLVNVTRGGLVPYTIAVRNTLGGALQDLAIVDFLPPGFKYVEGSSRFDGRALEPASDGRVLRWEGLELIPGEQHTIKLLLVVGAGVGEGEYVNRAQVVSRMTGSAVSGVATATVRVVPDPTFDCTDIIGKVFDDANLDGHQDEGEKGLAGVRIASARGLLAKTDEHGRFHITCAAVPNPDRGSNFILKLDDRTLPAGYRLTTENPLVLRATRGKAIKFNFGAALHRVVRLDIADGVFEPGSSEVRPQWTTRYGLLLGELRRAPSVLRISYLADVEEPAVVKARLEAVKAEVAARWAGLDCCYRLPIETEIYWRRGGPPERKAVGAGG